MEVETRKIFILNENEVYSLMNFVGEIPNNVATKQGVSKENIEIVSVLYTDIMNILDNE